MAPDTTGQWLASGSDDGTMRVWEVASGRCMLTTDLGSPVHSVAWCPAAGTRLLSAAAGNRVVILAPALGTQELQAASEQVGFYGGFVLGFRGGRWAALFVTYARVCAGCMPVLIPPAADGVGLHPWVLPCSRLDASRVFCLPALDYVRIVPWYASFA